MQIRIREVFDKTIIDKPVTDYQPNIIRLARTYNEPDRYGILEWRLNSAHGWQEVEVNND